MALVLSALVWLVFVAVTVLTLWLWAVDPDGAGTTPVVDLGFFALGAMIGAGATSQLRRPPQAAPAALAVPAAAGPSAWRVDGWRLPLWSAGTSTVVLGISSWALPDAPGSLGVVVGTAAAACLGCPPRRTRGTRPAAGTTHLHLDEGDRMNVLVAYATRHGSTAGIAEHVAATLADHGIAAQARPVEEVEHLDGYDAVVLGGAAYMFHWLKPAVRFARTHRAELSVRPVWLFSSGPLGTDRVDSEGEDVLEGARPREFDELVDLLRRRGERVFFGAYDPDAPPVGLGERVVRHMPAAREALPAGDFRDWDDIGEWARGIAAELRT